MFGRTAEMVVDVSDVPGGVVVFKLFKTALSPPLATRIAVIGAVGSTPISARASVTLNYQWKVLEIFTGYYSHFNACCDAGRTLAYQTNASFLATPITDDLLFPPLYFTAALVGQPGSTVTAPTIRRTMPAFVPGNRVELLVDGDKILASLLPALAAAQHHVHLNWFFFATVSDVSTALQACAARGVEVRLLFDQVATAMPEPLGQGIAPGEFLDGMNALTAAGVKIATSGLLVPPLDNLTTVTDPEYRERLEVQKVAARAIATRYGGLYAMTALRIRTEAEILGGIPRALQEVFKSARDFGSAGLASPFLLGGCRDHTKLIIIDGTIAYCGGANGQRYYLYQDPIDPARDIDEEIADPATTEKWDKWHDAFVRIEGPVVRDAQRCFAERWAVCAGEYLSRTSLDYFPAPQNRGNVSVKVVANIPGLERDIAAEYLRLFRNATQQIRIENPYVTDDLIAIFIAHAAQIRQVPVELIVPDKHLDLAPARELMKARWDSLRAAGVQIYAYNNHMLHVKVATADNLTSIVGSYNFAKSSADQLFEFGVVIQNAAFAAEVQQQLFDVDRPVSQQVTTDVSPDWTTFKASQMRFVDRIV
ncbi:MAG TPA: phospholipase D-like domain-containing protein [Vicinamibacterales bacterium]|nr:phospholipase D-like domain-containing protein [Vicinamibacterales bacterium]